MRALIARADDLNRRIYSSLPFGYRLANLLVKLSLDTAETFGRVMHKVFTKAQVAGLPESERIYARQFGKKAWKVALAKLRNPEVVEAAASNLMMRWLRSNPVDEGVPLKKAENMAISSLINAGLDQLRKKKRRREDAIPTDEEGMTMDIEDPRAWGALENSLRPADWAKIKRQVERLPAYVEHQETKEKIPRALDWVEAQLEGLTDRAIAEEWGVTPRSVGVFGQKWGPKIREIIVEHFRAAV